MCRLAIDQGFTAEEWSAIKSGESDLARSTAADTTAWPSRVPIINRLGSHHLTVPIRASGSGKRYRLSVSGRTPMRWANSALLKVPDCHLCTIRRKVAARQLCVMGKRAAVRSASTPCQLRVTSFASKSRLVDRHPLYVPASAAPHVRASHYGLRLAHDSEQYDRAPEITTTDWQTRSAGDEEVTTFEARGFDGWDHRRRHRALVGGCVVERCPDRVYLQRPTRLPRSSRIRLHRWAVAGDQERSLGPSPATAWPGLVPGVDSRRQPSPSGADQRVGRR